VTGQLEHNLAEIFESKMTTILETPVGYRKARIKRDPQTMYLTFDLTFLKLALSALELHLSNDPGVMTAL
jgi:hypothetical protein